MKTDSDLSRFIHEREAFRADDKYEVDAMEMEERLTAEALVFGSQGLRKFIEKFSPDEDPQTKR